MPTVVDELSVTISADTTAFRASLDELSKRANSFSSAIASAFSSAGIGGKDLDDVLKNLALRFSSIALNAALKPIESGIGHALSSGCFRMVNADVMDLYERVPVGTSVALLQRAKL